jgi:cytoskeletal protein CcmA (bactofilin family)
VVASLEGRNVDIRGQVTGNVRSAKRLSLSGSGSLQGDATAGRLVVEDGATLNGSISMGAAREADHGEESTLAEFVADAELNGDMVPAGEHEHNA